MNKKTTLFLSLLCMPFAARCNEPSPQKKKTVCSALKRVLFEDWDAPPPYQYASHASQQTSHTPTLQNPHGLRQSHEQYLLNIYQAKVLDEKRKNEIDRQFLIAQQNELAAIAVDVTKNPPRPQ